MASSAASTLRVLTAKLEETSPVELPFSIASIADLLISTDFTFLDSSEQSAPKNGSARSRNGASSAAHTAVIAEQTILFNKLKSKLSSLLADSSNPSGSWAAAFLIQAYISRRGWPAVEQSAPWVKSLVSLLHRPIPSSLRILSVTTLSTIFRLSSGYAQFTRETVTPTLPTFVRLGLGFLRDFSSPNPKTSPPPSPGLVRAVLAAFLDLLPGHPTIFRPFRNDLESALYALAVTPRAGRNSVQIGRSATLLLVELTRCAPRTGSSESWNENIGNVIQATHRTLNRLFRSIPLDLDSEPGTSSSDSGAESNSLAVPSDLTNSFGFSPWSGLAAGTHRVACLLELLSAFLSSSTPMPVNIPLGEINHLLSRILDLRALSNAEIKTLIGGRDVPNWTRHSEQSELLLLHLPSLHVSALRTATNLASVLGQAGSPVLVHLLHSVPSLFSRASSSTGQTASPRVREAAYDFLSAILTALGPAVSSTLSASNFSLTTPSSSPLTVIIQSCCTDLLQYYAATRPKSGTSAAAAPSAPSALFAPSKSHTPFPSPSLIRSACNLLPNLYIIPLSSLSASVRALVDRTTVLLQHETAFLASSLYPALPSGLSISSSGSGSAPKSRSAAEFGAAGSSTTASILPMAPRQLGGGFSLQLEGLVHPRFPAIKASVQSSINPSHHSGSEADYNSEPSLQPSSVLSLKRPGHVGIGDSTNVGEEAVTAQDSEQALPTQGPSKRARISSINTSLQALISDLTSFQSTLNSQAVDLVDNAESSATNGIGAAANALDTARSLHPSEEPSFSTLDILHNFILPQPTSFASSAASGLALPTEEDEAPEHDQDVNMDSSLATSLLSTQQVPAALVPEPSHAVNNGDAGDSDDDDEDFEIPTLVMGSGSPSDEE